LQLSALWILNLPDLRVLEAVARLRRDLPHENRAQGFVESEAARQVGEAVVEWGRAGLRLMRRGHHPEAARDRVVADDPAHFFDQVVLESAQFDPTLTRATARSLGIASDAADRFAQGVDPEGVATALDATARI